MNKQMAFRWLCWLNLIFISGCSYRGNEKQDKNQAVNIKKISDMQEILAFYDDIPDAPFGFHPTCIERDIIDDHNVEIKISPNKKKSIFNNDTLECFYRSELECLGWDCISSFHSFHRVEMIFERPKRFLFIHINAKDRLIHIILSKKKKGL